MIGYNTHDIRKLRPLIPRPMPSSVNTITNSTTITPPSHVHDFFARYQTNDQSHDEENKREHELNTTACPAGSVSSSRWNPTSEQLSCLEELYRRGTCTPSAEQIRRITAQLRCYGKIEGKNVFYWFQNHKARERQKRRRQMECLPDPSDLHVQISDAISDTGTGKTRYEVEQTKNWTLHTNCSILAEESISTRSTTAKARCNSTTTRTDGCFRLGEGELLQQEEERRSFITAERNATWHAMQLSCPAPFSNQFINSNSSTSTTYSRFTTTNAAMPTMLSSAMEPMLIKTHINQENISTQAPNETKNIRVDRLNGSTSRVINEETTSDQTLQLFPIECTQGNNSSEFTQFKFFEFLPLKS